MASNSSPKVFGIGRSSSSALKIPPLFKEVSEEHATLTIKDNGEWWIANNKGRNGIYVLDDEGYFRPIVKKRINPNTFIRLGMGGMAYRFMAYRVLNQNADYQLEFEEYKRRLEQFKKEAEDIRKDSEFQSWVVKLSGLIVLGLTFLVALLGEGWDLNPVARYFIIAGTPAFLGLFLANPRRKLKELRTKRDAIFFCPYCQKPLSEKEVEMGICGKCNKG